MSALGIALYIISVSEYPAWLEIFKEESTYEEHSRNSENKKAEMVLKLNPFARPSGAN